MDSVARKSPEMLNPKRDVHYLRLKNTDEVEAWYRAEASLAKLTSDSHNKPLLLRAELDVR